MVAPASPKAIDSVAEKAQEMPKAQSSSPSASIPNAVPVNQPVNQDAQPNVSSLSNLIARVMVAARYLLSGNFDIAATINDMALIEASTRSLTTAIEGCKNAVVAAKDSIIGFTQTLPTVVEAAGRVSTAFARSFPWLGQFFVQA
jgi:hypothetical protein